MTMLLLGSRPVGGEDDGVGLAIISEKDNPDTHMHNNMHTLATLAEKTVGFKD